MAAKEPPPTRRRGRSVEMPNAPLHQSPPLQDSMCDRPPPGGPTSCRNLVHNEQVRLAATFWNNLSIAALLSVFLVPAFYTRHTMLQQVLSIGVGLAAAIGLRTLSHCSRGCGSETIARPAPSASWSRSFCD